MTHLCKEIDYCLCGITDLEPEENCPLHGGGMWPPRCMYCGKFLPWSVRDYVWSSDESE